MFINILKFKNIVCTLIALSANICIMYGQSSFASKKIAQFSTPPQFIEMIDMNLDGRQDLLSSSNKISWFENKGGNNFTEHIICDTCQTTITVKPIDFDKDGDIDFIASHYNRNCISLWLNNGKMEFVEMIIGKNFIGAHDAMAADINNDGLLDIVGSRGDAAGNGEVKYWKNIGNTKFAETTLFTGKFCHSIDCKDINNDGLTDIVSAHMDEGFRIYKNLDGTNFKTEFSPIPGPHYIRLVDLDKDGDNDILIALWGNTMYWWENINGSFKANVISGGTAYMLAVQAIDIDADNDLDLLYSSYASHKIWLLINKGNSGFDIQSPFPTLQRASGIASGDIDNDGDIDVAGTSGVGGNGEIYLYENQSTVDVKNDYTPERINLKQNFPNPFNPSTTIEFEMTQPLMVNISIYDIKGSLVKEIINEEKQTGKYSVYWDGKDSEGNISSSGSYFCRMNSGGRVSTIKMLFIK